MGKDLFSYPAPSDENGSAGGEQMEINIDVAHADRTPRLEDVARQAGVSITTVSRVLNNTAPVSNRTRTRVEAAIRTLGYTPRQTGAPAPVVGVALLVTDVLNPFYTRIVRGAGEEIEADGLALLLFDTMEDPEHEARVLTKLMAWELGGVLVLGSRLSSEELIAFQSKRKVPMVVINRNIRHPDIACVLVDSERATYRATQYLLNLGHSRIAYLGGPPLADSSQRRLAGVQNAMNSAGLQLRPEWTVAGFPNSDGGFQAMSNLLATTMPTFPTGVIVYNDLMALGALHAIRSQGLNVPDDISVIGFDDIAMAAHANPPLTTISQPKYHMGRLAVQLLRAMRTSDPTPSEGYVLLESPLIIRESTAPPRTE
jgi:LacI family transcriptional regulator